MSTNINMESISITTDFFFRERGLRFYYWKSVFSVIYKKKGTFLLFVYFKFRINNNKIHQYFIKILNSIKKKKFNFTNSCTTLNYFSLIDIIILYYRIIEYQNINYSFMF